MGGAVRLGEEKKNVNPSGSLTRRARRYQLSPDIALIDLFHSAAVVFVLIFDATSRHDPTHRSQFSFTRAGENAEGFVNVWRFITFLIQRTKWRISGGANLGGKAFGKIFVSADLHVFYLEERLGAYERSGYEYAPQVILCDISDRIARNI